jgi:isocitrate dehydrogenase kinase/phosphatase
MISARQKAVLHVAKSQLRLSDENYRAVLREQGGVESSNDLTNATFDRVMRRFEELGFTNTARHPRPRNYQPNALVTPEQQNLIAGYYIQLGWTDKSRQIGFSKRCCKKSFPQTRRDANKVIEGLKAILKRG